MSDTQRDYLLKSAQRLVEFVRLNAPPLIMAAEFVLLEKRFRRVVDDKTIDTARFMDEQADAPDIGGRPPMGRG